ncbi:unnamed protein product [Onchocerca ochengi]|uniref:Neur_chan_memb domain-containing protein n=1 Tax=Onchocerca ochengi TaxID=42157 RepID=A0A182EQF0_ONCOC|nr:unnamed protein product [Onchocerca ochengi]
MLRSLDSPQPSQTLLPVRCGNSYDRAICPYELIMSMMIVVSNISKSTLRTFSFFILTVTIASTFDFGDPMKSF